ncbi:hypothetical protein PL321_07670 [Caloramator sp. mosi_1]|nr:hypothetical protein [Caloramator sp. mosi_1]WDC85675.1 hypothetical protein PL321_07670 [Caloramator sp. mosi_1]
MGESMCENLIKKVDKQYMPMI